MAKKRYKDQYLRKTFTLNGKRYYIVGRTTQELFEREQAKRREIETGELNLHNPVLNEYYDHFTKIRESEVKESTIRAQSAQYKTIAAVMMENGQPFGEMRIKDITRRHIEEVRQQLLEIKTPENLNICFAHLNHVLHSAVIDETIEKNPCKALKPLKRTAAAINETKHRALTKEETEMFFTAARDRNSYYYNLFDLMIHTGLRIGEVAALYSTDIDKVKGFLHVRRTIARTKSGQYIVGDSAKTDSGVRDIPLTDEIRKIIKDQEEQNRLFFGLDKDGLIFRSSTGDILREYTANREIKRVCTAAGVEYFTNHAFRNTFATRFIEQRPQDYKILSEILGHKDVSITLNLYTHVMTDNKIKAMTDLVIKTG